MPGRKRTGLITTNIRLPQALHKKLTQQAAKRAIPLNTLLIEMLEGYDAAAAKQKAEAMKPFIEMAIKEGMALASSRLPSREEMLAMFAKMVAEGPIRQMDVSPDQMTKLFQLFRERLGAHKEPDAERPDKGEK